MTNEEAPQVLGISLSTVNNYWNSLAPGCLSKSGKNKSRFFLGGWSFRAGFSFVSMKTFLMESRPKQTRTETGRFALLNPLRRMNQKRLRLG
jgi:hypothetical protein